MKNKLLTISLVIIILISIPLVSFSTVDANGNDIKLNIKSKAVILVNATSGEQIYSKNPNKKMYPASTTKILTAILAIENSNLDDIVTVSKYAISSIPPGYSSANLVEGEKISVENLLKVLLIHSANESANVLAEHVSGSVESFVTLMNKKLKELGCKNTHFVNTNGIHNVNHYTTARDLSILAQYCMKNRTFRQIVSMPSCTIPATNKSEERQYLSTNEALNSKSSNFIPNCIGIKTGFTSQAGNCIISAISKDDTELIAVALSATEVSDRYTDLKTLFDFGINKYPKIAQEKIKKDLQNLGSPIKNSLIVSIFFAYLKLI